MNVLHYVSCSQNREVGGTEGSTQYLEGEGRHFLTCSVRKVVVIVMMMITVTKRKCR
jgi:hypothetical protein